MSGDVPVRPAARQRRPDYAEIVFSGVLFTVWQWDERTSSGRTVRYEALSRPDTALVVPVLADGQVAFAVEAQPGREPEVRAFGGKIEKDETPTEAAARELREEAGYIADSLELWTAWQPVEKIDWAVYLFVARGIATGLGQDLDAGEDVGFGYLSAQSLLTADGRRMIGDPELRYALARAEETQADLNRLRRLLGLPG